jgi:uncharacterized protein (TIGR04222 family)
MNWNPLDLPGPAFLVLFLAALVVAHFAGKLLVRACRARHASSAPAPDLLPLEAAFLAGGPARAVDAALVGMLHHDVIAAQAGGAGFVNGKASGAGLMGLQAELYREIVRGSGLVENLRKLRTVALNNLETRLANAGLLLVASTDEHGCLRLAAALPMLAVIALGMTKVGVGIARGKPVLFLLILLVVGAIALGVKIFKLPLRSSQGEAALAKLRRRNAALELTAKRPAADLDAASLMLAVGLFGTEVLAGDDLVWMQQGFYNNRSDSSSSSGCGSSGGCGGGGGGGCGGCGG